MKNHYLKFTMLLSMLFLASNTLGQIYNADFTNNGDGFTDHSTATPPSVGPASVGPFGAASNQWSLSYTSTPSTDSSANSFKVTGGSLASDDWGGQGIFQSQNIDVSAINLIDISAITLNSGANENKFKYFYILDGGSRVETANTTSTNGDNVNYTISALDVSGANTIVVGFEFEENGGSQGYTTSSFSVSVAAPGITLGIVSGNTNETGTTATFSAVLTVQPSTNVVLNISSGDTGEVTVLPANLTFTNGNWNTPQNITATGIDDALSDGDVAVSITVAVNDATSDASYHGITKNTTITNEDNEIPSLIVNELLSDPAAGVPAGDSNGDGVRDGADDEFIEIYNTSGGSLDISGYTIEDGASIRHTFPSGTIIPANQTIIIFGGGEVRGVSGLTQIASTGLLSLNNSGDTITIKNASAVVISTTTYGGDANDNQSIARSPDFTGNFVKHTTLTGGLNFSPGKDNTDGVTPFTTLITWNGSGSVVWDLDTNWIGGVKPSGSNDVLIPNVGTLPTLSASSEIINLTVATNGNLSINGGGKLTIKGNILLNTSTDIVITSTITGTNTLNAGTLILKGGYSALDTSGQFFYFTETNKDNTDDWSLISSPVTGEGIEKFSNYVGLRTNNNNVAIAPYNNSGRAWDYYKTAASTSPVDAGETLLSTAGNFVTGKGYTISPNSTGGTISPSAKGNIGFQGNFPTENYTSAISVGSSNTFNLIGNPYSSYIPLNDAADATNNILRINGANGLNILSEDTVWIWDKEANSGNGDYVTINLGGTSRFISPAQGFFVSAKAGGGNFSFTETMQSHQATGIFSRSTNNSKIKLLLSDNVSRKTTNILYVNNKTSGFDNGYDSSMFSGVGSSFAIYTQLVSDNEGKNLAIQTLPKDFENLVIPIGIKVILKKDENENLINKEITISAKTLNFPSNLKVYLEDRETNIFTSLDETNSSYKLTLTANLNGIGRFYLHTTESALNIGENVSLENISVYKTNTSTLKITGLQQGNTKVTLFNILGEQIMNSSFTTDGVKEISLPKLAKGVYIVQLKTETGKLNKKIIIE
ncbi:MAG: lamin tail domain-containing protein [Polaribacter sp.]|uniref:lamin tail domain-containing protein n=1 Tax=Polaribacter sp. TaxID=1920175 RepID=UPI002F353071